MQIRCVNIDWLEVFAQEDDEPHTADYFRHRGFVVHEREYGTRVYHEMFVLDGSDGLPFVEIRRRPKNPLMRDDVTHIRFVNRSCYFDDAASVMQEFLGRYNYSMSRISRIDICMDFARFDDNTIPRVFMQRYMRGKFSKINQANIHSHGSDTWTGRVWNSVSWGSPSSMIGTKFYNKTLELYDPKTDTYAKPYIRQSWLLAGLIDNIDRCTLDGVTQEIWRVEFSIKSSVKRWFTIELDGKAKKYQSIHNTLDCYDSKEKLLTMFAALSQHYFRFKRYIMGQRKDTCPDRRLFNFKGIQTVIKPEHPSSGTLSSNTPDPMLLNLIRRLRLYAQTSFDQRLRELIYKLLTILEEMQRKQECSQVVDPDELLAWQLLAKRRSRGDKTGTLDTILTEIKTLLSLNDKTVIF